MKQEFMVVAKSGNTYPDFKLEGKECTYYQAIGVNDKNDKPIYFGSIVKNSVSEEGTVVWSPEMLEIHIKIGNRSVRIANNYFKNCEVIGHIALSNMFQHPIDCYAKVLKSLWDLRPETEEIIRHVFNVFTEQPVNIKIRGGCLYIDAEDTLGTKHLRLITILTARKVSPYLPFDLNSCARWLSDLQRDPFYADALVCAKEHYQFRSIYTVRDNGKYRVYLDHREATFYEVCALILKTLGVTV